MTDTPPITSAPKPSPDQSAAQQAQVAVLIVGVTGFIAIVAISAALWIALKAAGMNGGQAAVIVGIASSLLTIVATIVGGLMTALNAPSGVAAVIASAKKPDPATP